jgi:hypothetical protein
MLREIWHPGRWHRNGTKKAAPEADLADDDRQALDLAPTNKSPIKAADAPAQENSNEDEMSKDGDNSPTSINPPLEALSAVQKLGSFTKPVLPKEIDISWDNWYRDLISAACHKFASIEKQTGKVTLIVTVNSNGKINCRPVDDGPTHANHNEVSAAASSQPGVSESDILAQAKAAVLSCSQKPLTEFPAKTRRKSVTFEVEFVCTEEPLDDYIDSCDSDIEKILINK